MPVVVEEEQVLLVEVRQTITLAQVETEYLLQLQGQLLLAQEVVVVPLILLEQLVLMLLLGRGIVMNLLDQYFFKLMEVTLLLLLIGIKI